MEQRISAITLGVADLERAQAFYTALGWRAHTAADAGVVFFQANGMVFALWTREEMAEDARIEDNGGWGGVTLAHNVGSPAEVDALLADAAAAGGTISHPGEETSWGGYNGTFIDPDGHPWEVAHNDGWGLQPDGTIELS
jgi:predicted lactoylglutathione lyase